MDFDSVSINSSLSSSSASDTYQPNLTSTLTTATTNLSYDNNTYTGAQTLLKLLRLFIGLTGVIGNGLTCIIVIKLRARNNFTNTLIFSQTCIDLLTSFALITVTSTELANVGSPRSGILGELFCRLWDSWILLFACFSMSTYNLTAIALERYLAVNCPLWYTKNFSKLKAISMATIAWSLAPLMQMLMAIFQFDNEDGACITQVSSTTRIFLTLVGVFVFVWEYFIPVAVMSVAFINITRKLRQQGKKLLSSEATVNVEISHIEENSFNENRVDTSSARSSKKLQRMNVTKTLFMVYIIYVICWTPNQVGFLQFNLGGPYDFQGAYHGFSVILAMCNSSVNPFIYALQYKQYRSCLKSLFKYN